MLFSKNYDANPNLLLCLHTGLCHIKVMSKPKVSRTCAGYITYLLSMQHNMILGDYLVLTLTGNLPLT